MCNQHPITCQSCGNDDAFHFLCSECLAPTVESIAAALSVTLGGPVEEWTELAESMAVCMS